MTFERMQATLYSPTQAHEFLGLVWRTAKPWLLAGHKLHADIRADTRSLAQNRLLWQRLTDISSQVLWHGMTLAPEDWKIMLTASKKAQRAVPAIDGSGFVVLGEQTSQMTVAEMTELLELIAAFGAQRGVKFREDQP